MFSVEQQGGNFLISIESGKFKSSTLDGVKLAMEHGVLLRDRGVVICERCGREGAMTMSWFNKQMICVGPDSCDVKEHRHPQYEEAREAEAASLARGELNFPGIGKPDDL